MIRLFHNISSFLLVAALLVVAQGSAQAYGPEGYTNATTEFCIAKSGQLEVVGGDYNNATGAFSQGASIFRLFSNGYLEVIVPVSPASPWRDNNFSGSYYSEQVKVLFSQYHWHFGTENFLLTDLPPPAVLV